MNYVYGNILRDFVQIVTSRVSLLFQLGIVVSESRMIPYFFALSRLRECLQRGKDAGMSVTI